MFGLPTHEIIIVLKDGTEQSVMMGDCANKNEFIDSVKECCNVKNTENWKLAKYCTFDNEQRVIYECSIEEILKEN